MVVRVEVDHADEWSGSDISEDFSDSEVGDALDWLDAVDVSARPSAAFSIAAGGARRPNAHGGVLSRPFQPLSNRTQKLASHVRATALEEWEGRMDVEMSNSVTTTIRNSVRDRAIGKTRNREKADRATVEQAIDPRTRMVLFKMLNRGDFNNINGCISTGKEVKHWNTVHVLPNCFLRLCIYLYCSPKSVETLPSPCSVNGIKRMLLCLVQFLTIFSMDPVSVQANVYHATKIDGQELAIKVYKTSVIVFKDRDRYVQGNYRFRYGYCKHNPRKMVKTWAEKEMRNLLRQRRLGGSSP